MLSMACLFAIFLTLESYETFILSDPQIVCLLQGLSHLRRVIHDFLADISLD